MRLREFARKYCNDWDYAQAWALDTQERPEEVEELDRAVALTKTDPEGAFRTLLTLAEHGSVWSMNRVAWRLWNGVGTPLDPARAEDWYRRAYVNGSKGAMLAYSYILCKRRDYKGNEAVLRTGAADDFAPALHWLAHCRLQQSNARSVRQEVRPMLERAVEKGSPGAQWELSRIMRKGGFGLREIPQGLRLIVQLYERISPLLEEPKTANSEITSAPGFDIGL